MALGLGTRLGEYKDPETQVPRLRRPRSVASSMWNGYSVEISNAVNNCSFHNVTDFSEAEVEKITVQMLIKPDIHNQHRPLFNYKEGNTIHGLYLKNTDINAWTTTDDGSTLTAVSTNSTISAHTWYHIIALYDVSGTNSVELYVNNVKQTGSADDDPIWYSLDYMRFGSAQRDTSGSITEVFYDGHMQQMAMWLGLLSVQQIDALYFGGKPRSAMNVEKGGGARYGGGDSKFLFAHWPITKNDADGTNAYPGSSGGSLRNMQLYNSSGATGTWQGGFDASNHGDSNRRGLTLVLGQAAAIDNEYMGE